MLALGPVIQKQREAYVAASHFHSSSRAPYIAGKWLNLIMLKGLKGRHVPKPVSWGRRQGSRQESGQMALSPPAFLSGTCLLDWSGFSHNPLAFPSKLSCIFLLLHVPGTVASSSFCGSSVSPAQHCWGRAVQRHSPSALPLL